MNFDNATILTWRLRIKNSLDRVAPGHGIDLRFVTEVSQAAALVQAYDVYGEWTRTGLTRAQMEKALRQIFPNLEDKKPKW